MTDEPFDTPRASAAQDELTIAGIECFGHHGVFDFERRDGQVFVIDLTWASTPPPAATSDDLQDTVDYGSLVAAVKAAVEHRPRRSDRDVGRTDRGDLPQGRSC